MSLLSPLQETRKTVPIETRAGLPHNSLGPRYRPEEHRHLALRDAPSICAGRCSSFLIGKNQSEFNIVSLWAPVARRHYANNVRRQKRGYRPMWSARIAREPTAPSARCVHARSKGHHPLSEGAKIVGVTTISDRGDRQISSAAQFAREECTPVIP